LTDKDRLTLPPPLQDGKLFGIFDGHGGKFASTLLRTSFPEAFKDACKGAVADALLEAGADGTPRVAKALDDACVASQAQMPTEMPFAQSGSTGVVSWVHGGEDDTSVFASCLGDSKAQVPTQLSETLLRTLALALALSPS